VAADRGVDRARRCNFGAAPFRKFDVDDGTEDWGFFPMFIRTSSRVLGARLGVGTTSFQGLGTVQSHQFLVMVAGGPFIASSAGRHVEALRVALSIAVIRAPCSLSGGSRKRGDQDVTY